MRQLEDEFNMQLKAIGYHPEREVKFHPTRKWRFDFLIGTLAIEVEGGIWIKSRPTRHTSAKGFINDCEKYAEAMLLGYRVLRVPGDWVTDGRAIGYVERALK